MQNPKLDEASSDDGSHARRFLALQRRFAEIEALLGNASSKRPPAFTVDEISRVIHRIAAGMRRRLDEIESEPPPPLSDRLGSWMIRTLSAQSNRRLDPLHTHILRFADYLFRNLAELGELDEVAGEMLAYWIPAWSVLLLNDADALFRSNHPARRFFELLVRVAGGLDAYSGRRMRSFVRDAQRLELKCVHYGRENNVDFNSPTEEFVELLAVYQRENQVIEQRFIAKEEGSSNIRSAPVIVNDKMRQSLEGRCLARWVFDFLQNVWCKYLTVVYLREGVASTEWKEGMAAVETLLWSLEISDAREMRQAYGEKIDSAVQYLRQGVEVIYSGVDSTELFFSRLEETHVAIMMDRPPELGEMVEIPRTRVQQKQRDAEQRPAWPGRPPLVGEWYLWQEQARTLRCRLIEDNRRHSYMLFANFSGIQVARLDYEAVRRALSEGGLRRIEDAPLFPRLLAAALQRWQQDLEQREKELQRFLDAQKNAERRALEQEQRKQELERREQARQAEEMRAQAQAAAQAELQRQARERAIVEKVESLGQLQLGATVELIDDENRRITSSLGLILKRSGKMIFVDRFGKKTAELLPRELATKIVDGSAQVLNFGVAFEQTLQSVIGTEEETMKRRSNHSTTEGNQDA